MARATWLEAQATAFSSSRPRRLRLRRAGADSTHRSALRSERAGDEVAFGIALLGANRHAAATASNELGGTVNYFVGNVPDAWRTNVRTFGRITYRDIYPRIDIVYYGAQSHFEHDFVIRPGGDHRNIELSFEGVERVDLDERGDLLLIVDGVTIVQRAPVVYQDIDGRRRFIDARYVSRGGRRVGFHVGPHDPSAALVIDPILGFSTYVGGSAAGIALDGSGNIYLTGETTSSEGAGDAFVAKLRADGQSLVYWTYLGGAAHDRGTGIAVDTSGNAVVTGITFSTDFPVLGALQASLRGVSDAFVTKLGSNGATV